MKLDTQPMRLNYNVPQHLIPSILLIAETHGITPAYWLRKTLENAVNAYQQEHSR
ncbi:hypothetical protein NIES37_45060 [Tolypothrix tenuis PCC 7101]|uniref:Uncharacterized protein n=1 Tax=Tolypothrix tenuis PCC 7101 TaxID=231146 RepID=A0A1Z4N459_9CYAN|nr:hypothetical protein NIES37_45060 [Tolypothrix tenuis PCC 7101]BAZ75564.1 hypothetical protein NIES50_41520 [Aulosira laxa NIES-50]